MSELVVLGKSLTEEQLDRTFTHSKRGVTSW